MNSAVPVELGPRAREIVAAARELLEHEGAEGLSMWRIADRLGICAASIYKHLADKESLEAALISEGLAEWAELCEVAIHDADDPILAIGDAHRGFAQSHPHLYRLMTERPLPRKLLTPGVEDRAARPVVAAVGGDPGLAGVVPVRKRLAPQSILFASERVASSRCSRIGVLRSGAGTLGRRASLKQAYSPTLPAWASFVKPSQVGAA